MNDAIETARSALRQQLAHQRAAFNARPAPLSRADRTARLDTLQDALDQHRHDFLQP